MSIDNPNDDMSRFLDGFMVFHFQEPLPSVCCRCGIQTNNRIQVGTRKYVNSNPPSWWIVQWLSQLIGIYSPAVEATRNEAIDILAKVPCCETCIASGKAPIADSVDRRGNITLAVHPEFKRAVTRDRQQRGFDTTQVDALKE